MKKRMYDDQKVILSSCLDFIEEAISRGDSYSEITCGVQILFHSNYGTLRNMFSTYTPFPLHKYIKRRLLTTAYLKYKSNRIHLSTRDSFAGINQFAVKFYREFGIDICSELSEEDLQPNLDIDLVAMITNAFYKFPIIEDYTLNKDSISIEHNKVELLKVYISLKTFLLPTCMAEAFMEEDEEYKIFFLEVSTRFVIDEPDTPSVEVVHMLLNTEKFYDFTHCHMCGDSLIVFCPDIPDNFYDTYCLVANSIIPNLKSVVPDKWLQSEFGSLLKSISDADSFEKISDKTGIIVADLRKLVWDFLTLGYLRYVNRQEIH
ncbi:MAG: hypothetical protein IKG17_04440 [Mogibacterium sp.]|nr:hypothetical protein [Mogibacterium sp.]